MKYKMINTQEAISHIQSGDGEVFVVQTINDDTPIRILRYAEGFLLRMQDEEAEQEKAEPEEKDPEPKPKPEKKDTETKYARIDHGKVMALHNAGWNAGSIAMEVGCSAQQVRNIIKKFKDSGDGNDH